MRAFDANNNKNIYILSFLWPKSNPKSKFSFYTFIDKYTKFNIEVRLDVDDMLSNLEFNFDHKVSDVLSSS